MNPQQGWKAKLEVALFLGIHNCKKTSVICFYQQNSDKLSSEFFKYFFLSQNSYRKPIGKVDGFPLLIFLVRFQIVASASTFAMNTSPCRLEGKQGPKASIIKGSCLTVADQSFNHSIYIYIRTVSLQSLMSALFNWFKLVNRPFGQIKMHHAHDFCPQTSQEGIKYTKAKQQLELSCCKKRQKSPNQETGLGNRGHLKVLNDTKLILND